MKHLNGNLLVAVDIETSGLIAGHHDILEVCFLPLNYEMEPDMKRIAPFHMLLKPERLENVDLEAIRILKQPDNNLDYSKFVTSAAKLAKCVTTGTDAYTASEMFVSWFERLKLAPFKRIMLLGHNLAGIDIPFLQEWMGPETWQYTISPLHRDTMTIANFLNDVSDYTNLTQFAFPKVNLQYLCSQLKVDRPNGHNAFDDCICTAACYKKMVRATRY